MNFTEFVEPTGGDVFNNFSEYMHYGSCYDAYDPKSDLNLFEFITNGVVLNVVGLLGVVGNVLSMVVLSRPQMRSSVNCLLIGKNSFILNFYSDKSKLHAPYLYLGLLTISSIQI